MSRVASDIIRVKDKLIIKLTISLEGSVSEWSYLEFRQDDSMLDILSTSAGFIQGNRIILKEQKSYLDVCLGYICEPFECIIAYLDGDNLMKHETLLVEPEVFKPIQTLEHNASVIRTGNVGFFDKLQELHKILATRRSLWHLKLEVNRDINVTVLRSGKSPITVAFGKSTDHIVTGDFIFSIEPEIKNFVIPIELVWRHYGTYKKRARLSIFELVQVDFHKIPNVFYKSSISNSIAVSDCVKIEQGSPESFTSPLGEPLAEELWQYDYKLPAWRGNA